MSKSVYKMNGGGAKFYAKERNTMPNSSHKRVRNKTKDSTIQTFYFHFNFAGIVTSVIIGMAAPLPLIWKTGLICMTLLCSCHAKIEEK